ncbi:hypothetical protein J7E25_10245 [Agromyces sp. ISL-38]|uniref:hypothetical protein n=1 Tax=Agromyces sp. ISL-38 TaxID=2819107 RepID=UPI001BEBD4BD|nr:hypothetical protein [Agromyces sp. ISL-38]MBT2499481.1 hypothetical protein [Agromyces sp. ISL-38]MBT2517987.1 hypothetical protein [Streptomyces sp. ISL-90]
MSTNATNEPSRELRAMLEDAASFAGSDLKLVVQPADRDASFHVLGYLWNGMAIDVAVLAPPTDAVVIQLVLEDEFVRCIAHLEVFRRRGQRTLRRVTRRPFGIGEGESRFVRVLGDVGTVWVAPRHGNEDRASIAITCRRVRAATEAVWAEDVIGVRDVREQVFDEYDDLVHILVSELEMGHSDAEIVNRLHERLRVVYFDEKPGTAVDLATVDIAKALVAKMFR